MPFTLSIEDVEGHSFQYGFHLGTHEDMARSIAREKFRARVRAGLPTVTIALMLGGKIVDVFHGDRWQSEM